MIFCEEFQASWSVFVPCADTGFRGYLFAKRGLPVMVKMHRYVHHKLNMQAVAPPSEPVTQPKAMAKAEGKADRQAPLADKAPRVSL